MESKSQINNRIESLKEEINSRLDRDGIEFTKEILKLSEELDYYINSGIKI
ncbi:MAG TPA: Spo0E family sporulation regulatory protein-aspartic acid phosphatase [Clostridium sp.]